MRSTGEQSDRRGQLEQKARHVSEQMGGKYFPSLPIFLLFFLIEAPDPDGALDIARHVKGRRNHFLWLY